MTIIFDDVARDDTDRANYSESSFRYLNRTARADAARVREVIESWFSRIPDGSQADLKERFRSDIDKQHQSAFFELFLYELLTRLGYEVFSHPGMREVHTKPDFLVKQGTENRFYFEAKVVTGESDQDTAARARQNQVYDVIDRQLGPTDFFLHLDVHGAPLTDPPARKIADFLKERLHALDPDGLAEAYKQGGGDTVPRWPFEHSGWRITFRPIPKKPEARGRPGVRVIGSLSGTVLWGMASSMRQAIVEKARKYGEMELPYIVAIHALQPICEDDALDALFGEEACFYRQSLSGIPSDPWWARKKNGVWTSPNGPVRRQVSAVLVVRQLDPWHVPSAQLRLYHNPWAKLPYDGMLCQLPQAILTDGLLVPMSGMSSGELLGLSEGWPNT